MKPNNLPRCVRFGPYEVDFHTQELRKHGMKLKLSGQPQQILEMLLARPGELVTREELQKQLWTDDAYVDSNHGLNAAVNKLRDVLGDSAEEPKYVETLPRRGYRFIGTIQSELPQPIAPAVVPVAAAVPIPIPIPTPSLRKGVENGPGQMQLWPIRQSLLCPRLGCGGAGPGAGCSLRARRCSFSEFPWPHF